VCVEVLHCRFELIPSSERNALGHHDHRRYAFFSAAKLNAALNNVHLNKRNRHRILKTAHLKWPPLILLIPALENKPNPAISNQSLPVLRAFRMP